MIASTIIGLDIAKQIFQVHGVSADGNLTIKRKLRRSEVLGFFGRHAALSALKRAADRTSGHVRSVPWAMTSD
jgi:hypothetical protein